MVESLFLDFQEFDLLLQLLLLLLQLDILVFEFLLILLLDFIQQLRSLIPALLLRSQLSLQLLSESLLLPFQLLDMLHLDLLQQFISEIIS